MNCTLQALMAVSPFCSMMQQLTAAAPALDPAASPTLAALASLAAEFKPVTPPEPEPQQQQGWSEQAPKGKKAKASSSSTAAAASSTQQQQQQQQPLATLGGKALSPSCMNGIVATFNPRRAAQQQQQQSGANGKLDFKAAASISAIVEQEQEDAQEFLQFLVDAAHEEMVKLRSTLPDDSSGSSVAAEQQQQQHHEDEDEEWSVVTKKNKAAVTRGREDLGGSSLLSAIFRGSIKSCVKAKGVKSAAPSITVQPFTMLHLDVLDSVRSVEDALDALTHAELIHGYKVKGHDAAVEAEKVVKISKLPQVLLLAINRYSYSLDRGSAKLHHSVSYPLQLKMKPGWTSDDCPERRSAQYQLIALVTHHGRNASGGHYTAHVQQGDGRWLHFNDAAVDFVPQGKVLEQKPYLLVYQRA
ncbi:hypothetical protein OEZ86_004495 [Tetradesmus obliquus]|nr:hypothetical protein OEZ86_004495 [Tetradesmus obliquus]